MATTQVPARTVTICDCCKCSTEGVGGQWRQQARLTFKREALDYLGQPAADGTVTMDLCDSCADAVAEAINQATQKHRR